VEIRSGEAGAETDFAEMDIDDLPGDAEVELDMDVLSDLAGWFSLRSDAKSTA
jgi:hypothetical protein